MTRRSDARALHDRRRTRRTRRAEKVSVEVNGVQQGMFVQGAGGGNPVLLFLHGGPGMPEYWLTRRYPTGLDELFTVVWWEQRGAGLSYRRDLTLETMTVEQFVADTLEVTQIVCRRLGTPHVYLMAHSWGSFIGLQAVARAPELYRAYVGMAQVTHQIRSERESYEVMLARYAARGDRRMVRRLERSPVTTTVPLPAEYDALRDTAMHRLGGGTTRGMRSVVTGIFLPSLWSRDYSAADKVNLWRGKVSSRRLGLWDQMMATDLTRLVPRLEVPAYFLHGAYDLTVSYALAEDYARTLQAPLVGFYTFENSAHSPAFEEPERAQVIFREDVLTGSNRLADRR